MKNAFNSILVLRHPNPGSKFESIPILQDSQQSSQLQTVHPVAYWSRKTQPTLLNYEQNNLDRGNIGDTTWKAAGIQSLYRLTMPTWATS
jgi:hypothetical protein